MPRFSSHYPGCYSVSHSVCIGDNAVSMIIWIPITTKSCYPIVCGRTVDTLTLLLLHHLEEAAICEFVWETARLAGLFKCFHSEPLHLEDIITTCQEFNCFGQNTSKWTIDIINMSSVVCSAAILSTLDISSTQPSWLLMCNEFIITIFALWEMLLSFLLEASSSQSEFWCEGSSSPVWNSAKALLF